MKDKKINKILNDSLEFVSNSSIYLLIMMTLVLLITSSLFIFNVTISKYHLPIIYILSCIFYIILKRKEIRKALLSILIASIIFLISTFFIGKIYDSTADGNTYHKLTVGALKYGWNPLYESVGEFGKKEGNPFDILEDNVNINWTDHYAKGTETFAAVVYAFTDNIESGKVYTLLWIFIAFGISVLILKKIKISPLMNIFLSGLLAINPITVVQVTNLYVDGVLTLSLLLIVLTLLCKNKFDNKKEAYLILALEIIWCVNAKFTGLCFAAVFCFVFYIYDLVKAYIKSKKEFLKILRNETVYYTCIVLLSVLLIGVTSYTKNLLDHGHPFYPLYGKGHVENMVMKEIPKDLSEKNTVEIFLTSIFSKGVNVSPSYSKENVKPQIKVPFKVTKDEILNYGVPDIRMAGFGPLFSGIFILTIIGGVILLQTFIKTQSKQNIILSFIVLLTILGLLFLLDGNYWARYIPYLYILPLIVLIFNAKNYKSYSKISRILSLLIFVFMSLNTLIITYSQYINTKSSNEYIYYHLNDFVNYAKEKEEVKIKLPHHGLQGIQYNLEDLGIKNYTLTEDVSLETDAYMFKY